MCVTRAGPHGSWTKEVTRAENVWIIGIGLEGSPDSKELMDAKGATT